MLYFNWLIKWEVSTQVIVYNSKFRFNQSKVNDLIRVAVQELHLHSICRSQWLSTELLTQTSDITNTSEDK